MAIKPLSPEEQDALEAAKQTATMQAPAVDPFKAWITKAGQDVAGFFDPSKQISPKIRPPAPAQIPYEDTPDFAGRSEMGEDPSQDFSKLWVAKQRQYPSTQSPLTLLSRGLGIRGAMSTSPGTSEIGPSLDAIRMARQMSAEREQAQQLADSQSAKNYDTGTSMTDNERDVTMTKPSQEPAVAAAKAINDQNAGEAKAEHNVVNPATGKSITDGLRAGNALVGGFQQVANSLNMSNSFLNPKGGAEETQKMNQQIADQTQQNDLNLRQRQQQNDMDSPESDVSLYLRQAMQDRGFDVPDNLSATQIIAVHPAMKEVLQGMNQRDLLERRNAFTAQQKQKDWQERAKLADTSHAAALERAYVLANQFASGARMTPDKVVDYQKDMDTLQSDIGRINTNAELINAAIRRIPGMENADILSSPEIMKDPRVTQYMNPKMMGVAGGVTSAVSPITAALSQALGHGAIVMDFDTAKNGGRMNQYMEKTLYPQLRPGFQNDATQQANAAYELAQRWATIRQQYGDLYNTMLKNAPPKLQSGNVPASAPAPTGTTKKDPLGLR